MIRRLAVTLLLGFTLPFRAPSAHADDARTAELERKVDVLTQEIEALRMGAGVADTSRARSRFGFAPAASKVYGATSGVSIGGYGEALLEAFDDETESGADVDFGNRLDFLRAVVYLGHKFGDRLLFNSEIEWEHGGVADEAEVEVDPLSGEGEAELSGEVKLEFAYLDWMARRELGVRAGLLLVPVGLTNELHEPPVFLGARRPEVERRIVPTTWSANGIGLFGELPIGLSYRAYVTEGLNAGGFSATDAIRGGRQAGSQARFRHPALVARLDWTGLAGVVLGGSAFHGNAWQEPEPTGIDLEPNVTLLEAHARVQWRELEARALYARGTLADAGTLSDALGLSGSERLGERFFGGYVEAGWDVLARLAPGSGWGLVPYARLEMLDTQDDVPDGAEDPALELRITTFGAAVRPHPDVVLKVDRELRSNDADSEVSRWNVSLGYLF